MNNNISVDPWRIGKLQHSKLGKTFQQEGQHRATHRIRKFGDMNKKLRSEQFGKNSKQAKLQEDKPGGERRQPKS